MTPIDQARRYVAKCSPAISGSGGHNTAFSVVCHVVWGFALSDAEAYEVLHGWNLTCQPPWKEHELRHKIRDAMSPNRHKQPKGYKLNRNSSAVHSAPVTRPAAKEKLKPKKYDLQQDDLPEAIPDGAREIISKLFRPGEGIRIARGVIEENGEREVPDGGGTCFSREEWLKRLDKAGGNPNKIFTSKDKCGIYIAINPYKIGCTKDADVTDYRHALFEFDDGIGLEEQFNLYQQMRLPAAAIIYSGGKSIHCWCRIDAQDRAEYDERVNLLYDHFEAAGFKPDPKNKNPGRLSRLPNCIRFDRRQELLVINPDVSFTDWLKHVEDEGLGECDNFETLSGLDTDNDPNCVIGFEAKEGQAVRTTRYLCRGKAAWLIGPSGIGKSTLVAAIAISWALGKPWCGIDPGAPRKILIIQAENDRYDLAEMVQGIGRALNLDSFSEEWERLKASVLFKTETRVTGQAFVDRLQRLIDRERPEIVVIDPMLAFMGLDVNKQTEVTHFLRTMLNPVLEATGVVLIGLHHTGKPLSPKQTANWTAIDHAYAGLGSSELVNWARAVMVLRPVSDTHFELKLAKRGWRARATQPSGEWTTSIWLRHGASDIRWEQIDEPKEEQASGEDKPEKKEKGMGDLIKAMPTKPILKADLIADLRAAGFSDRAAKASISRGLQPGRNGEPPILVSEMVKRKGTRPGEMISLNPEHQ